MNYFYFFFFLSLSLIILFKPFIKSISDWVMRSEKLNKAGLITFIIGFYNNAVISDVANKQRNAIADWELQNPEWSKTDKGKEEYIQLVKSVMTDITEGPTENKIIKSIAKETVIDK